MSDSDVFISYSRRNKEFTQKLYDALVTANREVWADWDSIPAASDWFAEIKDGIEQAESVLFVLSPEWINSGECRKELEHAVKMGKRLFPILYRSVDPNEVPQELAKINWVYMRDEDDFDKGFEVLNSAMDVDLDWVKTHTRILKRALEWDEHNRDVSFVLRGNDLTNGEQFLSSAIHKSPDPTELQGEYILASRRDATRRQRMTMIGVSVALVVSVALGIVALFQWQAAARNAFASRAGELAALPYSTVDSHLDLASLLSVEAFRFNDSENSRVSLLNTWQTRPELRRYLYRYVGPVNAVAYAPDGRLATSGDDGQLLIWDNYETPVKIDIGQRVLALDWSLDSALLAVGLEHGAVQLYDGETLSLIDTLEGHEYGVPALAFSNDGRLASGSYDSKVIIWNVNSRSPEAILPHEGSVFDLAWSPDGTLAATIQESSIYLWRGSGSSYEKEVWNSGSSSVFSVAWSPEGDLTTGEFKSIYVWDMSTRSPKKVIVAHSTWVEDIAYSQDGTLASISGDTTLKLWFPDGQSKTFRGHTGKINSVDWGADGYLATGSRDKTVIVWQVGGHPALHLRTNDTGWVQNVAWSYDGTLATVDGIKIALWKPDGTLIKQLAGHTDGLLALEWSKEGRLASGGFDKTVRVWNVETGESQVLYGHPYEVRDLAWSSEGKLASLSEGGTIIVWDLSIGQPAVTLQNDGWAARVIWLPDGRLATTSDNRVNFWDVSTQQISEAWTSPSETGFSALNVSNDGTMLAAGDRDGMIIIWDLSTGEELMTLTEHTAMISKLEWSSTGQLGSAGEDWRVIVWDLERQVPRYILNGHTDIAKSLAWSKDGRYLATGGHDLVTILWDTDPENWIAENCARAGRNFTQKEWGFYFPGEEYRQTCPQWSAGQ